MNAPNNKRRKNSINRIEKAFVRLLQSNELTGISVSDVCKLAGLNRTTFYANYTDIYGLADSIRDKLETELNKLYQLEHIQHFNSNNFLKLFQHIYEHQPLYKTYFKLGYDNEYKIIAYDVHRAKQEFQDQHILYHAEFFRAGITKIIKIWLDNGCQETPEEMFEIVKSEYRGRVLLSSNAAQ